MNCRQSVLMPRISFFFQAEDGIRDVAVTGVQTCALPILCAARSVAAFTADVPLRYLACPNVVIHRMAAVAGDRKSTRLNSSHGYISYAVFCLKKKNSSAIHFATRSIGGCGPPRSTAQSYTSP